MGPGLQRKEAEALLARIIAKAEQVNAKPDEFLCGVVCDTLRGVRGFPGTLVVC